MWLDVNNDSWEDLYIATGTSMYTDYPNVTNFYPNSTNGLFLNPAGSLPLVDISASINWENELTFPSRTETTTRMVPWISFHIEWDLGLRCTTAWPTRTIGFKS